MEPSQHVARDAIETGLLSQGGLLAIAICGGIILSTSIGFLMAWMVKKRQKKSSARMYTIPDAYSQTRLTKRPLMMTESAVSALSSRFSSRFSLTLPPIVPLPPMPSYSNFSFFRSPSKRRRNRKGTEEDSRQSWVSGEEPRGGRARQGGRDAGEAWFSRDSWLLGHASSMLSLGTSERGGGHGHGSGSGGGGGGVAVGAGGENEDGLKPAPLRVHRAPQPYYEEYRRKQQEAYGNTYRGHPQQQPYQIFQQIPQQLTPLHPHQASQQQQQQQEQQQPYLQPHQQPHHQPYQQQLDSQHPQDLCVQKRRNENIVHNSQPTPGRANVEALDDATRGRQPAERSLAQPYGRPSMTMTDLGLRDILRSTDQRLREGTSQSPVKKHHHDSSSYGTPVKTTPQSRRSSSTRRPMRPSRATPSPHKGPNLHISPTRGSVTPAASAANSLIAEATERLVLPGGMASPSRLRGREWAPPAGSQVLPPGGPDSDSSLLLLQTPSRRPDRGNLQGSLQDSSPSRCDSKQGSSSEKRKSVGSDQSSSLSTLYSVGEPEREEEEIQRQYRLQQEDYRRTDVAQRFVRPAVYDDPFVEKTARHGQSAPHPQPPHMHVPHDQPAGPRPLKSAKSISPSHMTGIKNTWRADNYWQPSSAQATRSGGVVLGGRDGDMRVQETPRRIILQPPPPPPQQGYQSDLVRSKNESRKETGRKELMQSVSESSFTSASVHTLDSDATTLPACETPKAEWVAVAKSISNGSQSPSAVNFPDHAPTSREEKQMNMSSSPFSEEEILAMMMLQPSPAANTNINTNNKKNSTNDNSSSKRALPQPPRPMPTALARSAAPTALSPRPSAAITVSPVSSRKVSDSTSYYSTLGLVANANGSPSSRGTNRPRVSRDVPALGMTIAQLRRMNSVTSSYSTTSLTSTVAADRESDSPTLPTIIGSGGSGSVSTSNARQGHKRGTGVVGSKHYLNIGRDGSTATKSKSKPITKLRKTSPAPAAALLGSQNRRRTAAVIEEYGKENEGLGIKSSKDDVHDHDHHQNNNTNNNTNENDDYDVDNDAHDEQQPHVKVIRQNPLKGPSRDTTARATAAARIPPTTGAPSTAHPNRRPPHGPVAALIAQGRTSKTGCRDSVESLGMYDHDGFLLPTPEREARRRQALRM
ncbi:hypothetical protein E4U21_007035 [Claviceps maximensis]|nr:hypothetical protein E4U21_007035 [Claviceps maximensis]